MARAVVTSTAHFYRISGHRAALCSVRQTPIVAATALSLRGLNRALLARQLLLERVAWAPAAAVEHLVGMQGQEPQAPYLGLWSRLENFSPEALSERLAQRRLIRAGLMRVTIHLVSAEDYARLWPVLRGMLAAGFAASPFARGLAGAKLDEVVGAGHEHLTREPLTRPELGQALAQRWPEADAPALAMAATMLAPVVQVPPRGLWRAGGQARWAPAAQWLGRELPDEGDARAIVMRYLGAFGPATVADFAAWSGLKGARAIVEGVREELVTLRDAAGRELLDVPGAPLPDPDVAAPPRFLAAFDNAILAHADRARIIAAEHRPRVFADRLMRTFLLDGLVAGTWRLKDGELSVTPFGPLARGDRDAIAAEAERVVDFLGGDRVSIASGGG
jgi:winged helix DNA-binding protein